MSDILEETMNPLDPNDVQAALNARYVQLLSQLVQENAHLEAYVKQLTARITEFENKPQDAWGDQPTEGV